MGTSDSDNYAQRQAIIRDFALFYAERGLAVFRLWGIVTRDGVPTGCACGHRIPDVTACAPGVDPKRDHPYGKHPVAAGWQAEATLDPNQIDRWWPTSGIGPPVPFNLGVACGPSRVAILDVDNHGGVDGLATFRALEAKLGLSLTDTWVIRTGSGGLHVVLDVGPLDEYPAFVGNLTKLLGPGVDIRQNGNLFVGAGSMHIEGVAYEPVNSEDGVDPRECHRDDPLRTRPMPMPLALRELLHKAKAPQGTGDGHALDTVLGWCAERLKLVRAVLDDSRVAIDCPFTRDGRYPFPTGHSGLDSSPTATVLYAASPGNRLGGAYCAHGKCAHRTAADFLARFRAIDATVIAAADHALDTAGILPLSTSRPGRASTPPAASVHYAAQGAGMHEAVSQETPDVVVTIPGLGDPATNGAGPDLYTLLVEAGVRFTVPSKKNPDPMLVTSAANLALFLQVHPHFSGAIARNLMTQQILARRDLPAFHPALTWPVAGDVLHDPRHYAVLAAYLESVWQADKALGLAPTAPLHKAVQAVAEIHAYSPLVDMIDALPTWDGERRLACWVHDVLHVEDPVANRMGYLWLLQAVARVLQPGCQADLVLILEGNQGIGKDNLIRAMNAPFPHVDLGEFTRTDEAARRCHTTWIVSAGEVVAFRRADIDRLKSYITNATDLLRRFYTEQMVSLPRRFVLIGTSNRADYLSDTTGNRRFLPIACPPLPTTIDVDRFRTIRDQLYAECVTRLGDGEQWWPTASEARQFADVSNARVPDDDWLPLIRGFIIEHRVRAFTNEIVEGVDSHPLSMLYDDNCLRILPERRTPQTRNRIGNVLQALGWRYSSHVGRNQSRDTYRRGVRGYLPPDREPGEDDDDLPLF